jgi:hypothetical protein
MRARYLLVFVMLAAGPVATAAAGARTLTYKAYIVNFNIVAGSNPQATFQDGLYDARNHRVGSDTRNCTGLNTSPQGQICDTTFKLRAGRILARLAFHRGENGSGSVTGGTGTFKNAAGTVSYRSAGKGSTQHWVVRIKLR